MEPYLKLCEGNAQLSHAVYFLVLFQTTDAKSKIIYCPFNSRIVTEPLLISKAICSNYGSELQPQTLPVSAETLRTCGFIYRVETNKRDMQKWDV